MKIFGSIEKPLANLQWTLLSLYSLVSFDIWFWCDRILFFKSPCCSAPFVTFKESQKPSSMPVLYHKTQILFPGIFAKVHGIYLSSSLFHGEYLQEGTCLLSVWFSIPEAKILASLSTSLNFQTSSMVHSLSKTPWPHFFQLKSAYVSTLSLKNWLNSSWIFCNIYWSLCLYIVYIILQVIW